MSDRELLELAAKAAGIDSHLLIADDKAPDGYRSWNPLTDDGDALRLAVKCEIAMLFYDGEANAFNRTLNDNVERGSDPLAATRRAIVRAAAEIGRSMK